MRPHVVAQVAVSIDGATTGFEADQARFYALATLWQEDVTLVGADTILAQESAVRTAVRPGPRADGPLLAVVDSRHRVHNLEALRELGYWSDVLALYSDQTPARPPDSAIQELVTGYDRVDLAELLELLGRRGAKVVRVDSGGSLLGALLDLGLIDELTLLVHPVLVGDAPRWHDSFTGHLDLSLANVETFLPGITWLRYCIASFDAGESVGGDG
ncbi:dihydrofolate reductase family protein [Kribbella catacumbae]|uniref:dihydrofolate reductase family protein n=1 Tax=Kribbella catacumbae TaxID=460086 RepID=UPI00036AC52D|nr:dihydrofolate reductase family protein [Kribbella catacumbae]